MTCLCLPFVLTACATTGGTGATTSQASTSSNSPRLTRDEILAADVPNAYDVVDRLRRSWLRRDIRTGNEVSVVVDNARAGGAEALHDIPSVDIGQLQFITSDEATRRWPGQVTGTAILVIRQR
jgi:hypothetical protein